MIIEDLLYKLDSSKVRVIAGDLPEGYWDLNGSVLLQAPFFAFPGETITAQQSVELSGKIAKIDLKGVGDSNPVGAIIGTGIGAVTGFRFFGPLGAFAGAIAGHFISGNRKEVDVTCELSDGRKFVATMDPAIFQRLKEIAKPAIEDQNSKSDKKNKS
ncbi:MAG TPA: hypothetical protein V6D17_09315 [Candidatus Obscuribacterales bacterium]